MANHSHTPTNRAKKIIALLVILAGIVAIRLVFRADSAPKRPMFEEITVDFYTFLLRDVPKDEIAVHSMDGYFRNGWHYYHVTYSCLDAAQGAWVDMDRVYYGQHSVREFFDLNATLTGGDAKRAEAYREAVLQGDHRAFTAQEIEAKVNDFYALSEKVIKGTEAYNDRLSEMLSF